MMRIFLSKATKFFIGLLLLPTFPALAEGLWIRGWGLNERTLYLENPLGLCLMGMAL